MILASELRKWLDSLPEGAWVAIDDGGLALRELADPETYCEVGGIPYDAEAEECPL
jgi:hypothetical protein